MSALEYGDYFFGLFLGKMKNLSFKLRVELKQL